MDVSLPPYKRKEFIENEFGVARTGGCLRMELRREKRFGFVAYPFVGAVVHVDEQSLPFVAERTVINGETMVL